MQDMQASNRSPSSGEDWVTAPEDTYEPNNLVSRFSDCTSDLLDSVPTSSQDAAPSRLLSDAENERLNAKIDVLIGTLTTGRQVHFDQDPVTGNVDVTAEYEGQASGPVDNDCEADIAAYPDNFGRIIAHRREMLRSPASILHSWSSTESLAHTEYETWEDMVAAANDRYDREHAASLNDQEDESVEPELRVGTEGDAPVAKGLGIRQAVRHLERQAGEPRGHHLARISSTSLVLDDISPIPLDFNKEQRATTPSIHSEGSRLDCSSPLFMKSWQRMPQNSEVWGTPSSSRNAATFDRVSEWLDHLATPSPVDDLGDERRNDKLFGVFRDDLREEDDQRESGEFGKTTHVLKDVSNLRQPGYLKKNSFAVEKGRAETSNRIHDAAEPTLPSHRFGKALDEGSKRAYNNKKRPSLLKDRALAIPEETNGAGVALHRDLCSNSPQPLDHNPERAAHFELALARLEGRAAPPQSSPIQRYVYPYGVYGEDVEVDIRRVRCYAPRAVRYAVDDRTVAESFERVVREEHLEGEGEFF